MRPGPIAALCERIFTISSGNCLYVRTARRTAHALRLPYAEPLQLLDDRSADQIFRGDTYLGRETTMRSSDVDYREVKKCFKWIEISIAVQQRELLPYAKCGDQTVDRLPNRVPSTAQQAIVSGRLPR